jgi:hypothetical protein
MALVLVVQQHVLEAIQLMHFRGIGLLVLVGVLLAGCSTGELEVSSSAEPATVSSALIAARGDSEADPAQIEILEISLAAGRYPSDTEYRTAFESALECMRDAGIANVQIDEYWNAGLLQLGATYSANLDQENSAAATVSACQRVHADYIRQARASEEVIRGAQETIMREFLPAMIECLAERGFPVADDADFREASSADLDANEAEGTQTGCMESTGYLEAMTGPPAN